MNIYKRGQSLRFFGVPVTIQSPRIALDGRVSYIVEGADGSFFRARHESLTVPAEKEFHEQAVPFEVICMRDAKLSTGKLR